MILIIPKSRKNYIVKKRFSMQKKIQGKNLLAQSWWLVLAFWNVVGLVVVVAFEGIVVLFASFAFEVAVVRVLVVSSVAQVVPE